MFLSIVLCAVITISEISTLNITVQTKNGWVRGHVLQTADEDFSYYAFQGIPYAEPPVDDLRFEPPVPKKNWTGILNATREGNKCIQGLLVTNGSEDCLFINVYVPKTDELKSGLLPVMFWIYGGGFDSGFAEHYQPDFLIKRNVIIVTFNYRLGIFGFFSTGDLVSPGNYGLKDQVLALKWVNENIKNFGGDPQKVTIFGQSSGAVSVSYHLQSTLSKGLFQRAIMESGVTISPWALSRYIPSILKRICAELSVSSNSSIEIKNELKKIDSEKLQLISATNTYYEYFFVHDEKSGLAFGPVSEPEHDGAFFTGKSYELLSQENFTKVPCIVGFNSLELGPLISVAKLYGYLMYDLNNTHLIPVDLNEQQNQQNIVVSKIKNFYFGNGTVSSSDALNIIKFLSEDSFIRPIREYVGLISKLTPTYFYRFSYEGNIGNIFGNHNRSYPGVGHGEDVCYLWKMPDKGIPEGQDKITSDILISLWTNFAISGNPTPDPVANLTWKTSDENFTYLEIGSDLKLQQFPEEEAMQFWEEIYHDYGKPPFDTY